MIKTSNLFNFVFLQKNSTAKNSESDNKKQSSFSVCTSHERSSTGLFMTRVSFHVAQIVCTSTTARTQVTPTFSCVYWSKSKGDLLFSSRVACCAVAFTQSNRVLYTKLLVALPFSLAFSFLVSAASHTLPSVAGRRIYGRLSSIQQFVL